MDQKREDRTTPLARVMGVGRQQHGDKTAAAFICPSFEFSNHIPDKSSIFTAELEAIMSALRYIKSMPTTKRNKFVIFSDSKSTLQALLSKWDHPIFQPS